MVLSFSKIFYLYWKRMSIFAFSGERLVLGNYRECIWNICLFRCVCLLLHCHLPPWCQEGRRCSCGAPLPPCCLQLLLQERVVVVRLHGLISSPPILGLSTGNSTTKPTQWGWKRTPLLSYLLCAFQNGFNCAENFLWSDFLNCTFTTWFHYQFWACLTALLLIFCLSASCVSTV